MVSSPSSGPGIALRITIAAMTVDGSRPCGKAGGAALGRGRRRPEQRR